MTVDLSQELLGLIGQLPSSKYQKWIERALLTLVELSKQEIDRLDWKILSAAMWDLERGFKVFYPYKHIRKVSIFGSSRLPVNAIEYITAKDFAQYVTELGYMVITGGGGGIMQAGNEGAASNMSFALNIKLPFEQSANPFVVDDKFIEFKYFFTRKLFFLKESDAVVVFPGGFGTLDEVFECITLCQTGRMGPIPIVLVDAPGGSYWKAWDVYTREHLYDKGLVSESDRALYTITDKIEVAAEVIERFYRIYHSNRYVDDLLVLRLNSELSEEILVQLNDEFRDILVRGNIEKTGAFPQEEGDETFDKPRLVLAFNQEKFGRLYQLINRINELGILAQGEEHPELK